jgi:hypothetical protein
MYKLVILLCGYIPLLMLITVIGCGKDNNTTPNCRIENAIININITRNGPCTNVYGSDITVTANIPNVQYNFDNRGYQTNNQFNNIKAGNYTVVIKDANGCTALKGITIADSSFQTYGTYYAKVKQIINTKCISCHNKTMPFINSVPYFDTDCDILFYNKKIHNNATVLKNMPLNGSLTTEQINDIKEWYTRGGNITD